MDFIVVLIGNIQRAAHRAMVKITKELLPPRKRNSMTEFAVSRTESTVKSQARTGNATP